MTIAAPTVHTETGGPTTLVPGSHVLTFDPRDAFEMQVPSFEEKPCTALCMASFMWNTEHYYNIVSLDLHDSQSDGAATGLLSGAALLVAASFSPLMTTPAPPAPPPPPSSTPQSVVSQAPRRTVRTGLAGLPRMTGQPTHTRSSAGMHCCAEMWLLAGIFDASFISSLSLFIDLPPTARRSSHRVRWSMHTGWSARFVRGSQFETPPRVPSQLTGFLTDPWLVWWFGPCEGRRRGTVRHFHLAHRLSELFRPRPRGR